MQEIASVVLSVAKPAPENRLTLKDVKEWLAESLELRLEEAARFPETLGQPDWYLLASDADPTLEAMFVVAFLQDDSVTIMSGYGPMPEIRDFGECSFPPAPENVLNAFTSRFAIGGRTTVAFSDLTRWLAMF